MKIVKNIFPFLLCIVMIISCLPIMSIHSIAEEGEPVEQKTVLCIGDSITWGYAYDNGMYQVDDTYPKYMQTWARNYANVINAGHSGAQLTDYNDTVYYYKELCASKIVAADIAVIMLGTNDVSNSWDERKNLYVSEFENLVNALKEKNSEVDIYVCTSPYRLDSDMLEKQVELTNIQKQIAADNGYGLIDVYAATESEQKIATGYGGTLFDDVLHPNSNGRRVIAETVYTTLKTDYGFPEISNLKTIEDSYKIWSADTDLLGAEVGASVKSNRSGTKDIDVIKQADDNGDTYYHAEVSCTNNGNCTQYITAQGSLNNNTDNHKYEWWLNNTTVLNVLAPYMYLSFDYRCYWNSSNTSTTSTGLYLHPASWSANIGNANFAGVTAKNSTEWSSISKQKITNSTNFFKASWYGGDLSFSLWGSITGLDISIDLRDVRIELLEKDRTAIDSALANAELEYTFDDLVCYDTEYSLSDDIWTLDPDNIKNVEYGQSVTDRNMYDNKQPDANDTIKVNDADGKYFRMSFDNMVGSSGGTGARNVVKSGINTNTEGFLWMHYTAILSSLVPYMTLNYDYRWNGTVSGGTPYLYFVPANPYNYTLLQSNGDPASTNLGTKNSVWSTKSVQLSASTISKYESWYSGYAVFSIYVWNNTFNDTQTVDIRDFSVSFNKRDRLAINSALAAIDGVEYILGVTDVVDSNDNPDYYGVLVNNLKALYPEAEEPEEEEPEEYPNDVIFYSLERTAGTNIKKSSEYSKDSRDVIACLDEDGAYVKAQFNMSGTGGQSPYALFSSGLNNNTSGLGWIGNLDAIKALDEYITVKFDYRLNGTIESGKTVYLYPEFVDAYINHGTNNRPVASAVSITKANEWISVEATFTADSATASFYSGWIMLSMWSDTSFTCNSLDIRNIRLEVKKEDRLAINSTLSAVKGIDSIAKFTSGVSIGTDKNGNKDYYSLLTIGTEGVKFDVNDSGSVNVLDLVRLKKYAANSVYLSELMIKRADSDGDTKLNSADIAALKKELLK